VQCGTGEVGIRWLKMNAHTHVDTPHLGVAAALHLSPPCGADQHCLLRKSEEMREGGKEGGRKRRGGGREREEEGRMERRWEGGREKGRMERRGNEREDERRR
jgi:hypothetical protein